MENQERNPAPTSSPRSMRFRRRSAPYPLAALNAHSRVIFASVNAPTRGILSNHKNVKDYGKSSTKRFVHVYQWQIVQQGGHLHRPQQADRKDVFGRASSLFRYQHRGAAGSKGSLRRTCQVCNQVVESQQSIHREPTGQRKLQACDESLQGTAQNRQPIQLSPYPRNRRPEGEVGRPRHHGQHYS